MAEMIRPNENINITMGLHRPFNKPLKSLVWVCRFAKGYKARKGHDFYLDFFLWMLKAITSHADSYDEQKAEGVVKPQNAQVVLDLFANYTYDEIKARARFTLLERTSYEDKIIYSSYKNTSYYITLAKKVNLVKNRGALTPLGVELATIRDYHFFELSDKHRGIVFQALCPDFFSHLIIITQCNRLFKGDRAIGDSFFRAYLKSRESEGAIRYVTSFDKNYLEVLRHWVDTLVLCTRAGSLKKNYLIIIDAWGLKEKYDAIIKDSETFYKEEYQQRVKQEQQYERIRKTYEHHLNRGEAEFGYVNLYDIKKAFRLSYEKYNELLNSYYSDCRRDEIILFSNTVSSIDMRKRFIVAGNAVLKIRIIKKS